MNHLIMSLTAVILFGGYASAHAQSLHSCDWEAAHPSDPDRVGPGRASGDVDTNKAIKVCQEAIKQQPDEARFHYQLGRAIVYEADRNNTDWQVGMPHLEKAASLKHSQSMFVLGLMYKRSGDVCKAEPWTRAAAEQGLKSARITYVNDYLSGSLATCPSQADGEMMQRFLNDSRDQASGYYENMLLDALQRQLDQSEMRTAGQDS